MSRPSYSFETNSNVPDPLRVGTASLNDASISRLNSGRIAVADISSTNFTTYYIRAGDISSSIFRGYSADISLVSTKSLIVLGDISYSGNLTGEINIRLSGIEDDIVDLSQSLSSTIQNEITPVQNGLTDVSNRLYDLSFIVSTSSGGASQSALIDLSARLLITNNNLSALSNGVIDLSARHSDLSSTTESRFTSTLSIITDLSSTTTSRFTSTLAGLTDLSARHSDLSSTTESRFTSTIAGLIDLSARHSDLSSTTESRFTSIIAGLIDLSARHSDLSSTTESRFTDIFSDLADLSARTETEIIDLCSTLTDLSDRSAIFYNDTQNMFATTYLEITDISEKTDDLSNIVINITTDLSSRIYTSYLEITDISSRLLAERNRVTDISSRLLAERNRVTDISNRLLTVKSIADSNTQSIVNINVTLTDVSESNQVLAANIVDLSNIVVTTKNITQSITIRNSAPNNITYNNQSIVYHSPTDIKIENIRIGSSSQPKILQEYTFGPHSPSKWFAVGNGTKNTLAISPNGYDWIGLSKEIFSIVGNDVNWSGTDWVLAGEGGNTLATSSTGVSWEELGTSIFSTAGNSASWSGTKWVATGAGTNTLASTINKNPYPLSNWMGHGTSIFSTAGRSAEWNGSYWVAVGEGTNTIANSIDGSNWNGLGTSIFSDSGNGIAWNGLRWVAVGEGTNTIASSKNINGSNWTGQGTTIFSIRGNDVAWNGREWVAVGEGTNTVAVSTNGVNWTGLGTDVFSISGHSINWNGEVWIAGGSGEAPIMVSPDAYNWSVAGQGVFSGDVRGIAHNTERPHRIIVHPKKILAVGKGTNQISSSIDGINWISISEEIFSDSASISGVIHNIGWNGREWVAVGEGQYQVARSTDGINWDKTSLIDISVAYDIEWAPEQNKWVLVGKGDEYSIAYSLDASNWISTEQGAFIGLSGDTIRCIGWNGSTWVIGGEGGANTIAHSSDAETWVGDGIILPSYVKGLSWNGYRWVAVGGETDVFAYSADGNLWTTIDNDSTRYFEYRGAYPSFVSAGNGVGWGIDTSGGRWVAVGEGKNSIMYSTDTSNWTGVGTSIFTTAGYDVAHGGSDVSRWIAVGEGGNTIANSPDGIQWTGQGASVFTTKGLGVDWSPELGRWVAVGEGTNSVAYSSNGTSWTGRGENIFETNFVLSDYFIDGYSVAWGNKQKRWVAVGANNTHSYTTLYSDDGITWISGTSPFSYGGFASSGNGVAYSDDLSRWVAVGGGDNTIAYSADGKNWTGIGASIFTERGTSVAWGKKAGRWVATGRGGNHIAYSADGISWTGLGTILFYPTLYDGATDVAFSEDSSRWIVTGIDDVGANYNRMAYSDDSVNWNPITDIYLEETMYCIGYSPDLSQWVASGPGSLIYSGDGITWNPVYGIIGARDVIWARDICQWMAVGSGVNQIAYSSDGINWTGVGSSGLYSSGGSGIGSGIARGGTDVSRWVSVGFNGDDDRSIITSTNETGWVPLTITEPAPISVTSGKSIRWSSDISLWMGGVAGNYPIIKSRNGISWEYSGLSTEYAEPLLTIGYDIAWSQDLSMWVAVGDGPNHSIIYSYDSSSWHGGGKSFIDGIGYGVDWSRDLSLWVVVGSGTNTIVKSTDGINWDVYGNSIFNTAGNSVEWSYDISRWVAVGEGGTTIAYSADGSNWNVVERNEYSQGATDVGWSPSLKQFIATGYNDKFMSSPDGITWSFTNISGIFDTSGNTEGVPNGIIWDGIQWISTGQGKNTIATSMDGYNWQSRGVPSFDTSTNIIGIGTKIASNHKYIGGVYMNEDYNSNIKNPASIPEDVFLAFESDGDILKSVDGIEWPRVRDNNVFAGVGYGGRSADWSPTLEKWIAVGVGLNNTYGTSTDGVNWSPLGSSLFGIASNGDGGNSIKWGGKGDGYFIAGGVTSSTPSNIARSYDGINWTYHGDGIFTTDCRHIAWSEDLSQWLALGSGTNTIAYSTDGSNWTGLGNTIFTDNGNGAVWSPSGNRWVAVGGGTNTIAYSSDGINWTGLGNSTFSYLGNSVDWSPDLSYFVAGGAGARTFAKSLDGVNWINGGNIFAYSGTQDVKWNSDLQLWAAVGLNLSFMGDGVARRIVYSTDGSNWITADNNINNGNITALVVGPSSSGSADTGLKQFLLDNDGLAGTNQLDIVSSRYINPGNQSVSINIRGIPR
jgi:hypothetical protein